MFTQLNIITKTSNWLTPIAKSYLNV